MLRRHVRWNRHAVDLNERILRAKPENRRPIRRHLLLCIEKGAVLVLGVKAIGVNHRGACVRACVRVCVCVWVGGCVGRGGAVSTLANCPG